MCEAQRANQKGLKNGNANPGRLCRQTKSLERRNKRFRKKLEQEYIQDAKNVGYCTKVKWSEIPNSVKELWEFYKPQHSGHLFDILPQSEKTEKEWRQDLYNKHKDKHRFNEKEKRRREYLKRVQKYAKKDIEPQCDDEEKSLLEIDYKNVDRKATIKFCLNLVSQFYTPEQVAAYLRRMDIEPQDRPIDLPQDDDELTDVDIEGDDFDFSVGSVDSQSVSSMPESTSTPDSASTIEIESDYEEFDDEYLTPVEALEIFNRNGIVTYNCIEEVPEIDRRGIVLIHPETREPIVWGHISPQSNDCEEDVEEIIFEKEKEIEPSNDVDYISERNDYARALVETEPFDKSEARFRELLDSVGTANDYVPDGLDDEQRNEIDEWISHLENLAILSYQMYRAETFLDMFVAVVAYAKMYSKRSLVMELWKMIDDFTATTREIDPHGTKEWTGRRLLDNWELLKTNTIWSKVSYLLSAAMSMTACSTKKIEWSPFGLKLVAAEAAKEQLKAVDLLDALIKTFVWFVEVGSQCISEKSLAPLLYSDAKIAAYDRNCDYVLAYADSAIAGNIKELGEFEKRLDECISRTAIMKSAKTTGVSGLWLQNRFVELVGIKEKLAAKRRNTTIRQRPDGWSITGGTKVGKTILADLTMRQSLMAQGYCKDGIVPGDRILTKDMFDKYDSTWTSDILGVFLDDLGNSKAKTNATDMNHTAVIIKFFNNVAAQAIKAELNSKGVVFVDFRCGVVTSNVRDLDARSYSNCPESILRRFKHVTARVKPKYRIPGTTMVNENHPEIAAAKGSTIVDIWELDVYDCAVYEMADGQSTWKWELKDVCMDDGSVLTCKNIGLEQYLDVVRILAQKHQKEQGKYVQRCEAIQNTRFCTNCNKFPQFCKCPPVEETICEPVETEDIKPNALELGDIIVDAVSKGVTRYFESWLRPVKIINNLCGFSPIKKMSTKVLANRVERYMDREVTPILALMTPNWLYKTEVFQTSLRSWQSAAAMYDIQKAIYRAVKYMLFAVASAWSLSRYPRVARSLGLPLFGTGSKTGNRILGGSALLSVTALAVGQYFHSLRIQQYQQEFLVRRDALPMYAKRIRDGFLPKSVLLAGTVVLGLKAVKMWNEVRLKYVDNVTPQDISVEDVEKQPGWFGHLLKSIGLKVDVSPETNGTSTNQVLASIQKNVFWAEFTRSDGSRTRCNIIFPRKSVALFPRHVFYPGSNMKQTPCEWLEVRVFRSDRPGGMFTFKTEFKNVVHAANLDLVYSYVPNSPDIKSCYKWLPLSKPKGRSMCNLLFRDRGVKVNTERVCVEHGLDGHKYMNFYGGRYTSKLSCDGVCMGVLVTEGKPVLAGFHIGGNDAKHIGVMQTLTREQYDSEVAKLQQMPGIELSAEAVDLPETQYGREVLVSPDIHPKALHIRDMGNEAYIDILGSTRLRAKATSKVQKSILSDHVEELFGVKNQWGAPRLLPNWEAFNKTLDHIVNPSDMFLPSKLERARQDWIKPILNFCKELKKDGQLLRPLTLKEAIMGVPGVRFLDALVMSTGMGFPIFGPKSRWFTDIHNEKGVLVDRIPHPDVLAEIERIENAWRCGERANPVATATLKDEPTKLDSEKVRVFQAGAVALSILIRKYFLPIARVLSLNPLLSESAVGINAFSPQWDQMMSHVLKYSTSGKVIAWDYSKYDVRMNSQMTRAVWSSFVEIAETGDYSDEDLLIMGNAIADIVHPLIDYNGTLIKAYNMNTSGNNLTVNVNGVAGSLYVRMGFFEQYPDAPDFRSCVSALTYGDDFKGSVKEGYHNFNFVSFKEFLEKHGMKITLPDKSDDEKAFMLDEEADFLKRNSVYIPEIGTSIGALDEMSIFKSLHSNLKSKTASDTEVAMSCIDGAMHEWFAHGRDVYNDRRQKMMAVCERVDLPLPSVRATFDERVVAWKEKYRS